MRRCSMTPLINSILKRYVTFLDNYSSSLPSDTPHDLVFERSLLLRHQPFSPQLNVQNYWEAIGVIAAHKAGINPNALRKQGLDHLKSHRRLYSARSSGPRPYASSATQDKVYVHQLV
uniref:Uncharacterized protein n=1 Tax=Aegilops tauschii subsp. strangulata TaxID=200361 RepID=A0A453DSR0_AEGTS